MHRRGASRFCRNFFSHRTKTKSFVKETLLFSGNFLVLKKIMDKRVISRFSVENFMSHSAENFPKGILLFLRKFLFSKSFMDKKGGITFFRRNFLVSQCRKISWASFNVSENLWYEKFFCILGGITSFRRKSFVSHCRKTSQMNPLMFH